MAERMRAILPYVIVLALAAALYVVAMRFAYTPRADRLGPDLWPRAILALTMLVCVVRIVGVLRRPLDRGIGGGVFEDVVAAAPEGDNEASAPARTYPGLLLAGIAVTVAYVFLLDKLGFALDTALYLAALIRTGRYARWRVIVPTAIIGSLVFMFVFMKVVYLSLPLGVAPFSALSLALMQLMHIR
jgi:putative tricarboxylic transport membrane protein